MLVFPIRWLSRGFSKCSCYCYRNTNHRQCHYISCVVEGWIKLDKLYAKTYISCSMLYDEMYIDLQHILLVVTELVSAEACWLFKMPVSVFFFIYIWILFALLEWFWMLQRCMFLLLNCLLPKSFNQFCLLLNYNQCISAPFF